jgi:ribonuclease HI
VEKNLIAVIQALNRVEVHGTTNLKLLLDSICVLQDIVTQIQQGDVKINHHERGETNAI